MAKRRLWSSLSKRSRERAARVAAERGLSRRQARERYNRGTFEPFKKSTSDRAGGGPTSTSQQQRVYNRIMDWFPDDGYYVDTGDHWSSGRKRLTYYSPSRGFSLHPASSRTVQHAVRQMSESELNHIMSMSRREFQTIASGYERFWYH